MPDPNPHAARLRSIAATAPTDRAEALIAAADEIERLGMVTTSLLDPDMSAQEIRLHMGEITAQEIRMVRAVIRWANSVMCIAQRGNQ